MKKPILYVVLLLSTNFLFAQGTLIFDPAVPNVTNGIVDFSFDLAGGGAEYDLSVEVSFDGGADWNDIDPSYITGPLENVTPTAGISLEWNAMSSFPGQVTSNALLRVTARHVCGTNFTFNYRGSPVTYGTVSKTYNEGTVDEFTLCWFDRNLGAEDITTFNLEDASGNTDERLYGDLFQWGRGDDGHQVVTWTSSTTGDVTPTTTTLSPTDDPEHGNFITVGSSPFDWRDGQNNNLWQGGENDNNPCPPGWRVPTEAELNAERADWSSDNSTGAFASTLKWPVGGTRSTNGTLFNVGSYGRVWSSSVGGADAGTLGFGSGTAGMGSDGRARGMSVRCVRDN